MTTKRIGPKMQMAVEYVGRHPGCAKRPVAEYVSPHPDPARNWALGYEPVNRAIRAGLIVATRDGAGRYMLTLPANLLLICLVPSGEHCVIDTDAKVRSAFLHASELDAPLADYNLDLDLDIDLRPGRFAVVRDNGGDDA